MSNQIRKAKEKTPEERFEERMSQSYGTLEESQCQRCRWYKGDFTCEAFPKGIPTEIYINIWDHTIEYNHDGVSDDGLVFREIEKVD